MSLLTSYDKDKYFFLKKKTDKNYLKSIVHYIELRTSIISKNDKYNNLSTF